MTPSAVATASELILIDLSSIAHPIWHMSQQNPDPNATSTQIVARVRALTTDHPYAAVCCDAGRSFRKDIADSYKANRPESEAPLQHQIALAREQLAADGYPVWAVPGFEADDLIATAVTRTLALQDLEVLIVTGDKDLLQLVGPRVRAMSVRDGSILDAAGVQAKFGVSPAQIRDYLTLVGDASDNVKGAKGIGPKRAADLLTTHGSIEALYEALKNHGTSFTPALATALQEFKATTLDTTRALITLRTDVDIPFETIAVERVPSGAAEFGSPEIPAADSRAGQSDESLPRVDAAQGEATGLNGSSAATSGTGSASVQNLPAVRDVEVLAPAPVEWERQLEPRSISDAIVLSKHMYDSRLFSAYGTPQGVLSTIMAGREIGLQAMASLRAFDIIDGRPTYKADLIRALVLRSGKATYFRCTQRTATAATFITRRGDEPEIALTYTIEEARQAWTKSDDAWSKSGYGKNPADMLVARAGAKLARLVYPEVVHGMYAREEFD
jgi:5'-3' exonuclease